MISTTEYLLLKYHDYINFPENRNDNPFTYLLAENISMPAFGMTSILETQLNILELTKKEILKQYNSCIPIGKLIIQYIGYWFEVSGNDIELKIIESKLKNYESWMIIIKRIGLKYYLSGHTMRFFHDIKCCFYCVHGKVDNFLGILHNVSLYVDEYYLYTSYKNKKYSTRSHDSIWLKRSNKLIGEWRNY